MQLTTGNEICGFTLIRGRYIPEQDATLYEFVHSKTGAELCFMDCDIENKLFYAAFKTTPFDNTGVFHILEHSVLCGSELYPVREPFVELLKSSMQTFLNAITFSDKTVYPCSSRNEKDFLNLVKVYLDAVFAPRCTEDEKIFLQEGWHWETDDNGHRFKGVVFNEMKGALASEDSVLERSLDKLLFPDTCYGFNSGGDPESIPDLSFEMFRRTYAKYYHPSNCRLYLDGSIPLEKTLSLIDSYLSRFEKNFSLPEISLQIPAGRKAEVYYPVNEEEDDLCRSSFTMARIFSGWEEKEKITAMSLLTEVLTDSNSSPLKKAILDQGLGEDVEVGLSTGTAQSVLYITVTNTDKDREAEIVAAWEKAVRELIRNGLDKEEMEAGLASLEYRFREPTEPRALYRGITALESWLYGGDPALYLTYEELLQKLRERLNRGGFSELLYELLPDAPGMSYLWTMPSKTKAEQDRQTEEMRLAQMAEAETDEERTTRDKKNTELLQWQSTPDTQEQIKTLPMLTLRDIPEELYRFPTELFDNKGRTVITHTTDTSGLIYASYYFKLTDFAIDRLAALNFATVLLTELSTAKYPDIRKLQREIKILMGNISFSIRTEAEEEDTEHCTPYFIAKFSTVSRNMERAADLMREILLVTDFSDAETIRRVLLQEKESVRENLIMRGESAGITAALSSCTARYAVTETYNGFSYFNYLKEFSDNFERGLQKFRETMSYLQKNTFTQKRMILSLTANEVTDPSTILNGFEKGNPVPEKISPCIPVAEKKGTKLPAPIGFSAAAWYYGKERPSTVGSLMVAAKILSLNTLWNRIRVSGGAYGAGFSARRDNCLICYSYRDPSPVRSLKVFTELGNELLKWCDSDETVDKYIISTVSDMEPLISISALAGLEDSRILCGYSHEMRTKIRSDTLKTDKDTLRKWAELLQTFGKKMNTYLVGGEHLIEEPGRKLLDL